MREHFTIEDISSLNLIVESNGEVVVQQSRTDQCEIMFEVADPNITWQESLNGDQYTLHFRGAGGGNNVNINVSASSVSSSVSGSAFASASVNISSSSVSASAFAGGSAGSFASSSVNIFNGSSGFPIRILILLPVDFDNLGLSLNNSEIRIMSSSINFLGFDGNNTKIKIAHETFIGEQNYSVNNAAIVTPFPGPDQSMQVNGNNSTVKFLNTGAGHYPVSAYGNNISLNKRIMQTRNSQVNISGNNIDVKVAK